MPRKKHDKISEWFVCCIMLNKLSIISVNKLNKDFVVKAKLFNFEAFEYQTCRK